MLAPVPRVARGGGARIDGGSANRRHRGVCTLTIIQRGPRLVMMITREGIVVAPLLLSDGRAEAGGGVQKTFEKVSVVA